MEPLNLKKIDVNQDSANVLMMIKHVGIIRAAKIVNGRPYRDLYELSKVAGLGQKRMDDIFNQTGIILVL